MPRINRSTAAKSKFFAISLIASGLATFFAADSLLQVTLTLIVAIQFILIGTLDGYCYDDEWFQKKPVKILFITVGGWLIVMNVFYMIHHSLPLV